MTTPRTASPTVRMAIDYLPLVVFFVVNFVGHGPALARIVTATVAFMIAMVIALVASWVLTRHISPMLWITAILVLVFGGLTIYFHDERFIKMKPTFVYAIFAGVLGFGLATGRPLLQQLLATAYPGLDSTGWRKLTRNWAIFFAAMAVANEVVWRSAAAHYPAERANDIWVYYKFPGCVILTLVFAVANVPMLMRHGLKVDEDAVTDIPPEG